MSKQTEKAAKQQTLALSRQVTAIEKSVASLKTVFQEFEDLEFKIDEKHQNLSDLTKEYDEKLRATKVKLDLDIQAYELQSLDKLLVRHKLAKIEKKEYEKQTKEFEELKQKFHDKVHKEAGMAKAKAEALAKQEMTLANKEHEVKSADLKARNKQLEERVAWITKELEKSDARLRSYLDNQVKIAQATDSVVNVHTNGK